MLPTDVWEDNDDDDDDEDDDDDNDDDDDDDNDAAVPSSEFDSRQPRITNSFAFFGFTLKSHHRKTRSGESITPPPSPPSLKARIAFVENRIEEQNWLKLLPMKIVICSYRCQA